MNMLKEVNFDMDDVKFKVDMIEARVGGRKAGFQTEEEK
jgi:hypothetical protein